MRISSFVLPIALLAGASVNVALFSQPNAAPHLETRGSATQLVVDGQPFLMLSGELLNSSSSSLEYMKPIWPRLAAMGLNTVVTPLSWDLIEPTEGSFDFSLVDGLLAQARAEHQRVVFLWLASWKNGMSSYAPVWVKQDTKRFPRVMQHGREIEVLSPMGKATQQADGRAFAALMQHIKQVDAEDHTVLMMQVENEVGVLGDARDRSEAANQAFAGPVPAELTGYLKAHRADLYPDLQALWDANGDKTSGSWAQVFGDTARAEEIFMAWHYARFVHAVAAEGKAAYDIPMYVNTWLGGEGSKPGDYPSGCPEPWVVDIWKAARPKQGPGLDLYAPDLYAANFAEWSKRYHRDGNPFFIPETHGGAEGAANVFYAVGEQAAMGFSPFAIDSPREEKGELAASYHAIAALGPLLPAHQAAGDVHGFVLDKKQPSVDFTINDLVVHVSLDELFGNRAESGFGLVMALGADAGGHAEFLGVGKGFRVSFTPVDAAAKRAGLAAVEEGKFEAGKWVPGRRLNGDETDQGAGWRFGSAGIATEKATVYRFE